MTAESTAFRILRELTARPMTHRELAEILGLSAATISAQVSKLRSMALIEPEVRIKNQKRCIDREACATARGGKS